MCSGFIGEHPRSSITKECPGDGCKPSCCHAAPLQGPGSQPDSSLCSVPPPSTSHRIPAQGVPVSADGISLLHGARVPAELISGSKTKKQTRALQSPAQGWPGSCHLRAQRRAQLPQCQGHSTHRLMLCKPASPVATSGPLLML